MKWMGERMSKQLWMLAVSMIVWTVNVREKTRIMKTENRYGEYSEIPEVE
jgi:hypothetical protein